MTHFTCLFVHMIDTGVLRAMRDKGIVSTVSVCVCGDRDGSSA